MRILKKYNKMDEVSESFSDSVRSVVRGIKSGETLTYAEVASLAGRPKAYRAVGTILSKNYDLKIPCHRVIKSNGDIGEYNRGKIAKMDLLKMESENIL